MSLHTYKRSVYLLGGTRQDQSPFSLPDFISPEGSKNMRLLKQGVMQMTNGYAIQNSTAITMDTSGDAGRVIAISHYKDSSDNIRWVVVVTDDVNETEIHHSTNGGSTFTFLAEIASALTLEPHMEQFENTLIICFGSGVAVQKYDGSSVAAAGQTQPAAPSVATGAAGVLVGSYKYKTASVASNGTVGPYSDAVSILLKGVKASLTSITLGAGGARIARTLGDGDLTQVYYVVTNVSANSYTDDVPDKTLRDQDIVIDDPGDPPPTGAELSLSHRARMLYFETDNFHFTPVGKPESVGGTDNSRIGEGRGADNVKSAFSFEGEAIIFMESSIWALTGNGRQTYSLVRMPQHTGTVSKHSAARVPGGFTFIDERGLPQTTMMPAVVYMTGKDVRLFAAGVDQIISNPVIDTFATLSYQHRAQAWCIYYEPYNWLLFAIPTADRTYTYVAMDTRFGTWHPVDFLPQLSCADVGSSTTDQHRLLVGRAETAGTIYQAFTTSAAAGSNITATIRTKPIDNGQPGIEAYLTAVLPLFQSQSSSLTITQNVYAGFAGTGASAFSTDTINIQGTNVNFVSPTEAIEIKTSGGVRSHAKAHVLEWTLAGQTIWGMVGWDWWYQPWPQRRLIVP